MNDLKQSQLNAGNGTRVMEAETISKKGLDRNTMRSRGNFLAVLVTCVLLSMCFFVTGCDKDDNGGGSSSKLVGTWQSVGYYTNYAAQGTLVADISEKITFKSNGKGVYATAEIEKSFDWKLVSGAEDFAVDISIAPSIHNSDNWNYGEREYELISATELIIYWSNARVYSYKKIQ
jgi:hypothetical protein